MGAAGWMALLALAAQAAGGAPDGGAPRRPPPPAGEVVREPEGGGAPPTAAEVPRAVPATGTAFAAPAPGAARAVDPGAAAPRPARGQSVPPAPDPVAGLAPSPVSQASPQPSADLQACVDDQLASRGLNAYGDPAATVYRNGPPVPEGSNDRYRRVLQRYAAIRTACRASPAFR